MSSAGKRGYTAAGRHGAKKQKLTAMSKEIKTQTKTAKAVNKLHTTKAQALAAKKAGKREQRARIPYNRHHQILTVGEGNFSFTRALVENFIRQAAAAPTTPTASSYKRDQDDDDMDDAP